MSSLQVNQDQGYESTLAVIEESLADLRMEYIDLYLIHWPIPADHDHDWKDLNLATWRAMEKCYREGKLRAIGVSNFLEHHLQPLMAAAEIPVMVNEMEMNVGYYQREIHRFCLEQGIQIVAYSPLKGIDRGYPALEQLAQKYSRTPAQIALRWLIQLGMIPIPRSYDRERIKENTEVFDFNLTPAELELLCSIQDADRHHQHPDSARFQSTIRSRKSDQAIRKGGTQMNTIKYRTWIIGFMHSPQRVTKPGEGICRILYPTDLCFELQGLDIFL